MDPVNVLSIGSIAPEINGVTTAGDAFRLSEQTGLCTVLYFYPKAFTPGCTRETIRFRDNFNELALAGVSVAGISTDDPDTQCQFATELQTPFPLIADRDKTISRAYDVLWPLLGVAKRVTYVVASDRVTQRSRRVLAAFRHELDINRHTDDVLLFVNELYNRSRS